ncbi:MAG: N-acetylmuramoyl-L-alanine amidase, partial [Actinobacteria bacterium]|nr:N-acetylmuramoyl-L-alanine amidase [Actinomycetota bacterium]
EPGTRRSVNVGQTVTTYDVSTKVTSSKPVAVERAQYLRSIMVCLDPGHSTNCPSSEIDPLTGLDVADNSGAAGELQTNWDVAIRTTTRLERMGYTVKLTKPAVNSYASLRTRADIGNTCSIMVRIHYDFSLHAVLCPAEGQYKQRGDSIVYVNPGVAAASGDLAGTMFPYLQGAGIARLMNDCGGTSGNSGPAFVGSVLSTVPIVLIENDPAVVRDNPSGQEQVAAAITEGIDAYFRRAR